MDMFVTRQMASGRPAVIRVIAVALLVSALLIPPCLAGEAAAATPAGTGDGWPAWFPFGFATLQVATRAPVNVSTTPIVVASPVTTVQTAAPTAVATVIRTVAPGATAATPVPTQAVAPMASPVPAATSQKKPAFSVAIPLQIATTSPLLFTTMPGGTARPICLSPLSSCQGTCVDTRTDPHNCGYCRQRCNDDQRCSGGRCVNDCPSGETNLYTDNNNCGQCGHPCPAGQSCLNLVCVNNISPDLHDCGNGYVSFNNDYHCGACFHECQAGMHCSNGECKTPCGNTMANLESDPNNCGACGNACPYGMCCDGACVNWNEFDANCGSCGHVCQDNRTCMWGLNQCLYHCIDANGTEWYLYHLNSDDNCGGCNIRCGSGTHCVNGRCMQNCPEDAVLCPDNTCVPRSTQNCAACGIACRPGETCTNHQCVCPEGYGICDGACVELGTRSHCSSNCQPCQAGFECKKYLQSGTCMQDCPYGYLSCGDGSCKYVKIDPANCGACGNACAAGQFCVNGICSNSCPAGSTDCQNDGTCDNPSIDPRNCGGCGTSCPNQTDLCVNGVCQYYCGMPAIYENRCYSIEVGGLACSDKRTDPLNCGGCGDYCNLHETCVDGECVDTCPAGTQWCDGAGCTYTMSDRNNCGSCGHQCGVVCWYGSCWPW